jgi:tRNA synthetases class I (W and Y)
MAVSANWQNGKYNTRISTALWELTIPTILHTFISEKQKATFEDLIRIAHIGWYSHISNTSFDTIFQLSEDIIDGKAVNITLNIGVWGIQKSPSIVLPGYILWWLKMLESLQQSISGHFENCTIRFRVHIAMNEAIAYNNYDPENTRKHWLDCIYLFRSFVKKYFPHLDHLIYFDFSDITDGVDAQIQMITKDIEGNDHPDFIELKKKLEKMGERHGSDKWRENALLYAVIHILWLQDIAHTATIDPTFHDLENHYHISAWGKAEQNFNLLRAIIRERYGMIPEWKKWDMHAQLTSETYNKPPYYQDEDGDIPFWQDTQNYNSDLSPWRKAQLTVIQESLGITTEEYLGFIWSISEELSRSNTADILNTLQNSYTKKYFENQSKLTISIGLKKHIEIDITNPEAIDLFLKNTEKSIVKRGFLPYHFEEKSKTPEWRLELIRYGTDELIGETDLLKKLKEGKELIVKFGIDPTGDEIHIGHLIPIKHLRLFQELGYQIRFLIWTFTATIGDPDKNTTRQVLSNDTITQNIATYLDQVGIVLKREDPKMQVVYNKDWYGKWWADDMLWLTMKWKVGQMLQKQQFAKRLKNGQSIAVWEFIYPLLQWWDSVVLNADVELWGTDQKFNLLMGRSLQEWEWTTPQTVITFW